MRVNRGLLNWGVFFIALGGVPLLVQLGRLESSVTADLWRVWPLILVGIGLGLVLRLTPLAWLGGALVAGTFGLLFGSLLAGGVGGLSGACVGPSEEGTTSRSGLASTAGFDLAIEMTCGDVRVARAPERWVVEAVHEVDEPPRIEASTSRLAIGPDGSGSGPIAVLDMTRQDWELTVPTSPLDVGLTLNFASADLELGGGEVRSVGATLNFGDARVDLAESTGSDPADIGLTVNFGSATVVLPSTGSARVGATLNFASLELCLGPDAALRVESEGTLSSDDFAGAGLEEVGGGWQTPGYDGAVVRSDVEVTSTFSSIGVDRSGTCG